MTVCHFYLTLVIGQFAHPGHGHLCCLTLMTTTWVTD